MLFATGGLFGLVLLGVWLFGLFDSITAPAESVRFLPKIVWILVVIVFFGPGAIAWLLFGRPRSGYLVGAREARPSSIGPDDDPDFLRSLNRPE